MNAPSKSKTSGKQAKVDVVVALAHLGPEVIRESSGILAPKKKVLPELRPDQGVKNLDNARIKKSFQATQERAGPSSDFEAVFDHSDMLAVNDNGEDHGDAGELAENTGKQVPPKQENVLAVDNKKSISGLPSDPQINEIPPTKIPDKYHIVDHHPIRPKNDTGISYGDAGWVRKWFPSDRPGGRREVAQLARTFEAMLAEVGNDNTSGIEKEQQIYDIVLHEIIRQVSVECADRGLLLNSVSKRYRRLFARIPGILSELQQEIDGLVDANKSLRMLLERLMEEKSVIESMLNDTRSKDDGLAEQNNSYTAEIQRYKITIQHLIEERDSAIEEARRQQEQHYYQEKMNAELLDRDEFNKSIIKKMSEQLEDAINSLHEMEAKYLASIAQNRAARLVNTEEYTQYALGDLGRSGALKDGTLSEQAHSLPL